MSAMTTGVIKGPHAMKLRQAVKAEAYKAFLDENVSFVDFEEWCTENCERWKIEADLLKRWIIDEQQKHLVEAKQDSPKNAAKLANLCGATLKATLKVYVEALGAVKVKKLVDRNGKLVTDENGQPIELSQPDWEPRLKAAEGINKILGTYAPEKQELILPQLDEFTTRTEVELRRELATLRASQGNKDPARIESETSGEGLPLLASECDDDQGRAERGAIPSVPGSALLSTHLRRTQ